VADLGEGPGGPVSHPFGVKKAEMTEEKKAGSASRTKPPPYPSLLNRSPHSSRSESATPPLAPVPCVKIDVGKPN